MNKVKISLAMLIAIASMAIIYPAPAIAEDTPIKDAAKQAGRDAKEMGKKAGKAAKEVGKSIGQASKRTYKTIKREFRKDFIEGKPGDSTSTNNSGGRQ